MQIYVKKKLILTTMFCLIHTDIKIFLHWKTKTILGLFCRNFSPSQQEYYFYVVREGAMEQQDMLTPHHEIHLRLHKRPDPGGDFHLSSGI